MGKKRLCPNHILQTRIYLMKLIIYGTGIFSEVLLDEIYENSKEVVAFTLDDELIDSDTHMGIPLIPFSNIESKFNPSEYDLLIGITYQNKNETRKEYFLKGLEKGYSMNGFISNNSNISKNVSIGKNNIILSGNLIQTSLKLVITIYFGTQITLVIIQKLEIIVLSRLVLFQVYIRDNIFGSQLNNHRQSN